MAAPRGPRPGNAPPNYNPSSLADGMQNLQINRPVGQPPSVPNSGGTRHRPPYGQQPPPFSSLAPGASPMTRPGATHLVSFQGLQFLLVVLHKQHCPQM
ncbi:hypothetical protein LOK49_LG04G01650 [Camellia lanceoleosa]|uniref:Uncharacterized protein n=1 Tax=Camellia lanceoleosa TaxID=1840588 RepID=A0ACC0I2I1_9ERIC|nr:hypothetical protein LOK49_LG04G01650 [Camellia lanceoleosa]